MTTKLKYKTKQHDELLAFLKETGGRHITVAEISEHFKTAGKPIGTATIYRHLEKMVDEGAVNKYTIDNNSSACFEYIGEKTHTGEVCFHYKCEVCGKLVHLHCEEFKELEKHLYEHHGFMLDPMRTVFYGVCSDCGEKRKTE
ncbi:MAG: transcriptional repressor [Firmicutes bacterium]|nr:transcriptional repressor [Bacillota bacterium]